MPLACFGQMDSLEYRLRSHIRTSLRTFYILKIVLLPRNPWQHIAYLKLNQPKIKATKFPQKIVCGNATDTALYISANGNAAETLRKRETRPHFALTCFRPPEMWRKLEPSDFRKISEIRKRLISPCAWYKLYLNGNNSSTYIKHNQLTVHEELTSNLYNLIRTNKKLKFYSVFKTDCHKSGSCSSCSEQKSPMVRFPDPQDNWKNDMSLFPATN